MPERIPERMQAILKDVSRSFYLTLRVLPGPVRPQIGLAYLLARVTDTIADTRLIPAGNRLTALQGARTAIQAAAGNEETVIPDFREWAAAQQFAAGSESRGEIELLRNIAPLLQWLRIQSLDDRRLIRDVLEIIMDGQKMDLERFGGLEDGSVRALADDAELEHYIYSVAGCVGEFWTRICRAHLFPGAVMDDGWLLGQAVRFGKGLQLVNILRDLPGDLSHGRCYLPRTLLAEHGLRPEDLLDPASMSRFGPLLDRYIARAEADLAAGWEYTLSLPWRSVRVKLACAWPALIGIKTLARLRSANPLDSRHPVKISRSEVRALIWSSLARYPCPKTWRRLFTIMGKT